MRRYSQEKKGPFFIVKILLLTAALTILVVAAVKFFNLERFFFKGPQTVVQLITDTGLKSDNGRVNVLLLGIGGRGHDGPDLTDTILIASVDKDSGDSVLVSIPRDLWAPRIQAKINSAYAFGQEQDEKGLELTKETVSELFGLPIHYAARVDFNGFIKAVDLVGGLDINVDTAFFDYRYPLSGKEDDLCGLTIEEEEVEEGVKREVVKDATGAAVPLEEINDQNDPFVCRYETLTFSQGPIQMEGETALKYVRSRHGTNGEGSDFARSARQQKVILAFREKVFSTQTLLNPKTVVDLIGTFDDSIDTDIEDDEVALFVKLSQKIEPQEIRRVVLDSDREESVLTQGNPQDHGGQFVLMPKNNSWHDLAEYVQGEIFKLEKIN